MWFSVFLSGNLGIASVPPGEEVRDGVSLSWRKREAEGEKRRVWSDWEPVPSTEGMREKSYCGPGVKTFPEPIFNEVALLRQTFLVQTALWRGDMGSYFIGGNQELYLS